MHRGSRGEHGGVGAEHVAVIALVAVVVTAIWAIGLPERVGEYSRYAVCLLFGEDGSCEAPGSDPTGPVLAEDTDPPVCTVAGRERDQRNTTDLLFRRTVDGERFAVTELSDGTVVILDTEYDGGGVVIGGGVELPLSGSSKLGASATGSGITLEEAGIVYVLEGESLVAYQEAQGKRARDIYMHGGTLADMQMGGGASSPEELAEQRRAVDIVLEAWDDQVEQHATHDLFRTAGEVALDVGVGYKLLSGVVTVAGSTGSTIQVERATGAYDLTIDLSAEMSQGVGVGLLGVGATGGHAEAVGSSITLSYDRSGELVGATTNVTFEATATGFVGFDLGGVPGAPTGTEGGFGFDLARGALVETTFALPVDSQASATLLEDLLADPAGTAGDAFRHAVNEGSAIAQAYELDETSSSVGVALRALVSAGVSSDDTARELRLIDAVSYDGHNGLMRRGDCIR